MIIVTGGAGFIGSGIVARLNELGQSDILIVDHFDGADDIKRRNLDGKKFRDYLDKAEFRKYVLSDTAPGKVEAVVHMGACSSTMLTDAKYYEDNNFAYTLDLARWTLAHNLRFIYASSAATYGDGSQGYGDDDGNTQRLRPLNLYGESKHKFDLLVLKNNWQDKMTGLKFFNVFGPNEYHKGDMRSVVAKAYHRVAAEGRIALFKSYKKEYGDGEQQRDFIYVKDAIDIVMFFLDNPRAGGIYNVGTGEARSWNDFAQAIFSALGRPPQIDYIEMPENLRDKYQYFTRAEMGKLRRAGYAKPFTRLEEAVRDYVGYLSKNQYL